MVIGEGDQAKSLYCNYGSKFGRWRVDLRERTDLGWKFEDEFRAEMENKADYTPCLFFELKQHGYSVHI